MARARFFGAGTPQRSSSVTVPASTAGINAVTGLASMQANESIYMYNLLPADGGLRVRDGQIEWANGWTGSVGHTLIAFEGSTADDDKLFVANEQGIWDITDEDETSPTQVVTFPSTVGDAGYCTYINFTNDNGNRFLLVCDAENGYYTWDQSTNTWTKIAQGGGPNQIANVDPADFNYVLTWKGRVWFIEKNTGNAWYLAAGVFLGAATKFNFGLELKNGGELRAIVNWTLDGGEGLDDYMVIVSGTGDVLVYQGTDPAAVATFGIVGRYSVGRVPAGNRIAQEVAGDVFILTSQGLVPMTGILRGDNISQPDIFITDKISPLIRAVIDTDLETRGWQIHLEPSRALLTIVSPPRLSADQLLFSMYTRNSGWGMQRGVSVGHMTEWRGRTYFVSATENRVFYLGGDVDNVYIDQVTDGEPQAITWELLTAYQTLSEMLAANKRVHFCRPLFLAQGAPAYTINIRYDFDISQDAVAPVLSSFGSGSWNTGVWNASRWGGSLNAVSTTRGTSGVGQHVAIHLTGTSSEPTVLIAFDTMFDQGGLL